MAGIKIAPQPELYALNAFDVDNKCRTAQNDCGADCVGQSSVAPVLSYEDAHDRGVRRGPLIPSHRSLNRNRDIGNGLATDRNGTEGWNASFTRRSRTTNGRIHRLVDDGRMEGFRGYWMQWAGRLQPHALDAIAGTTARFKRTSHNNSNAY